MNHTNDTLGRIEQASHSHAERGSAIEREIEQAIKRAENNLAFARDLRTCLTCVLTDLEDVPQAQEADSLGAPTCDLAECIRQITRVELLTQDVLTDIKERLQL